MGSDVLPKTPEIKAKKQVPLPSWWRAFFDWRVLMNALLLGSTGRHAMTFTLTLEMEVAFLTTWSLGLILAIVGVMLVCDMIYALCTNYRYQFERYEYSQNRKPDFKAHNWYAHNAVKAMHWTNLIKYAFRGTGAAIALAMLFHGSAEITSTMLFVSVAVGTVVGMGLSIWNEFKASERKTLLKELKTDDEKLLRGEAIDLKAKQYTRNQKPLYLRAITPQILLGIALCGELARRAFLFPHLIDESSMLFGETFYYAILPAFLVLLTMDIVYSYIKNFKEEYEIERLANQNLTAHASQKPTLTSFDTEYHRTANAEVILKNVTLLRYFFPAASVIIALLMVSGKYEGIENEDLSGSPVFGVLEGNQMIAILVVAAFIGIGLAVLANNSETEQKNAVNEERSTYLTTFKSAIDENDSPPRTPSPSSSSDSGVSEPDDLPKFIS